MQRPEDSCGGDELGATRDDPPPVRFFAEYARRWAAADADGVVELAAPGWVMRDRRSVAVYGQMFLKEGMATVASSFRGVRDPRFTVYEVLACSDSVIAATIGWSGIGYKGAEFSNEMGIVAVVRDGLWVSGDLYEPEDREAMLARFRELAGGGAVR